MKDHKVSAIEKGTVIDHLPESSVFRIINALHIEDHDDEILIGVNLQSSKKGRKSLMKMSGRFLDEKEKDKIALLAEGATLSVIENYEVVEKRQFVLPEKIEEVVKCFNPSCVTNNEKTKTYFYVVSKDPLKLKCAFCERNIEREYLEFL